MPIDAKEALAKHQEIINSGKPLGDDKKQSRVQAHSCWTRQTQLGVPGGQPEKELGSQRQALMRASCFPLESWAPESPFS